MGRVSLTEDYDDRSVIAKLNEMDKRVTENTTVVTSAEASAKASAQAAQETADRFAGSVGAVVQNANAQINASKAQVDQAKAEVDETVTTVAQAVQTANNASASAQESATTVATYDTRLTAVEDADTQNVKLSGDQNISGIKTVPTEATGTRSQQITNSAKVGAELDAYDQMVRTTGNQTIGGEKTFTEYLIHPFQKRDFAISQSSNTPWVKLIEYPTSRRQIRGRVESTSGKAFFIVDNNSNTSPTVRIGGWGVPADSLAFTYNDGDSKVGLWFKTANYESIKIYIDDIGNYSGSDTWPYLTIVSPLEYKALPVGNHITYSSAWAVVQ